jgi:hypothetical protein
VLATLAAPQIVIPAKAGTQPVRVGALNSSSARWGPLRSRTLARWVPAFAGMTPFYTRETAKLGDVYLAVAEDHQ